MKIYVVSLEIYVYTMIRTRVTITYRAKPRDLILFARPKYLIRVECDFIYVIPNRIRFNIRIPSCTKA